jgi:hypothetical protein
MTSAGAWSELAFCEIASSEFRRDEIDASGDDAVITVAATQHRHSNS